MTDVGERAARRPAWGEALGTMAVAVVGAAVSIGVFVGVPADAVALRAVAVYTTFAAAVSVAFAIALVTSRSVAHDAADSRRR